MSVEKAISAGTCVDDDVLLAAPLPVPLPPEVKESVANEWKATESPTIPLIDTGQFDDVEECPHQCAVEMSPLLVSTSSAALPPEPSSSYRHPTDEDMLVVHDCANTSATSSLYPGPGSCVDIGQGSYCDTFAPTSPAFTSAATSTATSTVCLQHHTASSAENNDPSAISIHSVQPSIATTASGQTYYWNSNCGLYPVPHCSKPPHSLPPPSSSHIPHHFGGGGGACSSSSGAVVGGGAGLWCGSNVSDLSHASSSHLPICRICHWPADKLQPLISPCRCLGTLQYLHNSCLQRWVNMCRRKHRRPPRCELCGFIYIRHRKFRMHHWTWPRVSQRDRILHISFVVNVFLMLACAIATIMCFLSDQAAGAGSLRQRGAGAVPGVPTTKNSVKRSQATLSTDEGVTLLCGIVFFLSFFTAMTVEIKAKHNIYQLFMKFISHNSEWHIVPYDRWKDKDRRQLEELGRKRAAGPGPSTAETLHVPGPPASSLVPHLELEEDR